MKIKLLPVVVAGLTLAGCGSDDSAVTEPVVPVEPTEPVETVAIEDADSINIIEPDLEGDTSEITFNLATDDGKAITGLSTVSLDYVGIPEPKEWTHFKDTMGLPGHEIQRFNCTAEDCNIAIVHSQTTPGHYTLNADDYDWETTPAVVKASITIVDSTPVWLESTLP
ncbi:hypothetical protein SAMN04488540_103217 [Ferrimonas sediminum]|uniref:Lipoprotein n=1 Tax=Ferrimonas sediminum TaxID=718193 RepID=A0A1G8NSA3_9GAMM|nr:hypothetical protein [Ferrimonas sediminum]SDI83073.1 hypothetical protein SAMN04488540_103217 [Ferrimonas sediminum]